MLLKLTGSSCSGKTTLALAVAGRLEHAAVHDFDWALAGPIARRLTTLEREPATLRQGAGLRRPAPRSVRP